LKGIKHVKISDKTKRRFPRVYAEMEFWQNMFIPQGLPYICSAFNLPFQVFKHLGIKL
jgi:hypothetical protein